EATQEDGEGRASSSLRSRSCFELAQFAQQPEDLAQPLNALVDGSDELEARRLVPALRALEPHGAADHLPANEQRNEPRTDRLTRVGAYDSIGDLLGIQGVSSPTQAGCGPTSTPPSRTKVSACSTPHRVV